MNLKKTLSIVVLFIASCFKLHSATEPVNMRLSGATLLNGAYISVTDNKWPAVNSTGSHTTTSAYSKLVFGIDERILTWTNAHNTNIDVNIVWRDASGTSYNINNVILKSSYDPSKSVNTFTYQNTYVIKGAHQILVYINKIYDPAFPSVALSSIPANLFLEAEQVSERYYQFDPYFISLNKNGGSMIVSHNTSQVSISNELEISWKHIPGAEEYDLEWTFVNDYTTVNNVFAISSIPFAFQNNATRIRTSNLKYKISLNYEHGYILYRLRGIGRLVTGSQITEITGDWSAPDPTTSPLTRPFNTLIPNTTYFGSAVRFFYPLAPSLLQENKNIQYSASFAEEGKKKEVLSYFDGSLRNRQTVTRSNTEEQVIVGETYYDHQGRAAVNALPVPAYDNMTNAPEHMLKYYEDFNLSDHFVYPSTSQAAQFDKQDFDLDVSGGTTCPPPSYGMKTTNGSSKYYSSSNPDKEGAQAYVADAEKYPFTQTAYMPDNTGRIRKQSGVGDDFKIGSGHETTNLYSVPLQQDLDELFGSEAGNAERYKKNTIVDPNGQVTVSYLNKDGKVVATAMVGNNPANLNSITAQTQGQKTVKYLSSNDQNYTNVNTFDGSSLVFSWPIVPNVSGLYTFTYNLNVPKFQDLCMPGAMCYDCDYTLELTVKDECGGILYPASPNVISVNGTINYACGAGITFNTSSPNLFVQATLDKGKQYYLEKKLTINPASMKTYLNDYLLNNSCIKQKSYFITQAMASIDPGDCNITCASCATNVAAFMADHNNPASTDPNYIYISPAEAQALYDKCNEACKPVNKCETEFKLMLGDVSPGGQYGKYETGSPDYNANQHPLSIYNTSNQLPQSMNNLGAGPVFFSPTQISSIFQVFYSTYMSQYTNCYAGLVFNEWSSWRKPYFYNVKQRAFLNTVDKYHFYDDADGTQLSIIPLSEISPGVYSPSPLSLASIKTGANNLKYVYPEELLYLKDFISNFKPTWSYSLVKNHPEWCYFKWCEEQSVLANPSPYSSSDGFDNFLKSVDNWNTATHASTVSVNGFDASLTGGVGNSNIVDLINNDPYFLTGGQGLYAVGGHPAGYLKSLMIYRLTNFMIDPTNPSSIKNAKETANYIARYAPLYYYSGASPCTFGNPTAWPVATITQAQKDNIQNKEWQIYRDFYLTTKAEIQAIGSHMNAINKSTNSHCGCYNGCIGNTTFDGYNLPGNGDYDGFAMLLPYTYSGPGFSLYGLCPVGGYYQNAQPCNADRKALYATKQKRFMSSSDMLTSMGVSGSDPLSIGTNLQQGTEYELYQKTGQCPMAQKVQFFLNDMVKTGIFNGVLNNVDLYFHPSFTKELYDYADNNTQTYSSYYFVNNSSNGPSIHFDFVPNSPSAPGPHICGITLTGSGSTLWSRIVSFGGIKYTTATDFEIYAFIDHDNNPSTPVLTELITVTSCFQSNCSFTSTQCKPNKTGKDLLTYLNFVFSNFRTHSSNLSGLYGPSYNMAASNVAPETAFLSPALYSAFSINNSLGFYLKNIVNNSSPSLVSFELDNGSQLFKFLFTTPGTNVPFAIQNMSYFSNLTPDPGDPCTFYLTANHTTTTNSTNSPPVMITTTQTFQVVVTMSGAPCISVGDCSTPIPLHCNTAEYNTLLDFKKFLNEIKQKYPANPTTAIDIGGYNYFTDNLKAKVNSISGGFIHSFVSSPGQLEFYIGKSSSPDPADCPVRLQLPSNVSWFNITSFGEMKADLTENGAFSVVVYYNANQSATVTGSSCFDFGNCEDCSTQGVTIFTEDFDRFNSSVLPNNPSGSDFGVSDYLASNYWKVTEQQYAVCSQVGTSGSFGGFLPPPYPANTPDVYHLTVTNTKFDWWCTASPPGPQYYATQHTQSNNSTAAPPENQPPNQDMLCLFVDYSNIGSNSVLPAIIYHKVIPATPGKKYRISFWYNCDARIPMTAKIEANYLTINSIPMSWYGEPMAWRKMEGIYINGNNNVLSFMIKLENQTSSLGRGVILMDDIMVEELNCDNPLSPPPVTQLPENECLNQLTDIATYNGNLNYQYYVDSVSASFKTKYINKCKITEESIFGNYNDKVHHYTLYYYDQAGNLIKTVPPEGVSLVNLTSHQATIDSDRNNGTQNFYTDHTMTTNYEYNSLNQLVKQKMPDHDAVTSFESNPLPGSSGLATTATGNDLDFYPNGNDGVLVGKNSSNAGVIYTTSDGGNTWALSSFAGSGNITKMQHMGGNNVFAVTSTGNVLRSNDNGATWYSYGLNNGSPLNSLAFFESTTPGSFIGLVGGNNAKMYWCHFPSSGSIQFSLVAAPNNINFDVKTIKFVSYGGWSSYRFFVVAGTNGVILHSYNIPYVTATPSYWSFPPVLDILSSPVNSNITINDMSIAIDNNAYIYGYMVGKDVSTNNGFAAYVNFGLTASTNNQLSGVVFPTLPQELTSVSTRQMGTANVFGVNSAIDDQVHIGGINGQVYNLTYNTVANVLVAGSNSGIPSNVSVNQIEHADRTTNNASIIDFYAFCSNGTVYKSQNNTGAMTAVGTYASSSFHSACIKQPYSVSNPLFIGSGNGTILSGTPNTGLTTITLSNATQITMPPFNGVSVAKDNSGAAFAVGDNGTFLKKTSASAGWNQITTGTANNFSSVYAISQNAVIVTSTGGNAYKYNGTTFALVGNAPFGGAPNLNKVRFKDANNGYIVGDGGNLYTSSDGGTSFAGGTSNTSNHLKDISLFGNTGLLVGNAGTIKKLNSGTWASPSGAVPGGIGNLKRVFMLDNTNAFAFSDNGKVIKSTDGGNSWVVLTTMAGSAFNAVSFNANAAQMIVAGSGSSNNAFLMNSISGDYSSRFYYDQLGRLIISQNAKQYNKSTKAYSYTVYDALGRITKVGEIATNTDPKTLANYNSVLETTNYNAWLSSGTKSEVTSTLYDNSAGLALFTQENLRKRVSATYIDTDDNLANGFTHASYYSYDVHGNVKSILQADQDLITAFGNDGYKRLDYKYDLVSGKVNEVIYQPTKPDEMRHKYEYDADNRLTNVLTSNDGGINWQQDAKYYYYKHGPLARTELGHNKTQGVDYAYTLQGWIKGVNSTILDGNRDIGKDAASGSNYMSSQNNLHRLVGNDAFAYNLNYFSTNTNLDYQAIDASKYSHPSTAFDADPTALAFMGSGANNALYNGNISAMQTTIVKVGAGSNQSIYTAQPQLTTYKYDQLNRINEMRSYSDFINNTVLSSNAFAGTAAALTNAYRNEFTYDGNGNILNQKRYSDGAAGSVKLDDLSYRYDMNGSKPRNNRLYHVNDAGTTAVGDINDQGAFTSGNLINSNNNYSYDEIGNLVKDNAEEINQITWTVYGKIKSITRLSTSSKPDLEFVYDSQGNRVQKIVKAKSAPGVLVAAGNYVYTHYVRDAQGNILSTYERMPTGNSFKLMEQNKYGSSRIGLISSGKQYAGLAPVYNKSAGTGNAYATNITAGSTNYELSNHLGNVLTSLSDRKLPVDVGANGSIDYFVSDILSASDYYAFGSPMPGRQYNNGSYRYGYGGHEKVDEISGIGNMVDMDGRYLDTRLGRTPSLDAKANKYPFISPYAYALNNPISVTDPDGKDVYLVIWATANGEIGHAAIAVSNYRTVVSKVMENGKEVTKTEYVPDGTFTYYDLWPGGEGAGKDNAEKDVSPIYQKIDKVSWNGIFNQDPSGGEGRNPEGIIKFETNYEQDQNVIKELEKRSEGNAPYNGVTNNCSDFAEAGIEAATGKNINADEVIKTGVNATTPNSLFKATEKLPGAKVLRDPGDAVNNGFIEGAQKIGGSAAQKALGGEPSAPRDQPKK